MFISTFLSKLDHKKLLMKKNITLVALSFLFLNTVFSQTQEEKKKIINTYNTEDINSLKERFFTQWWWIRIRP